MSVHFICGKPGGGKSLYAMRLVADELLKGSRPVVTNLAINFSELWVYLKSHGYSGGDVHIRSRVRILEETELKHFFCFRGYDGVEDVAYVDNDQWKLKERMSFTGLTHGVFYVLDEVHLAFPSRDWANTGQQVLWYLSQHRKLGDDVLCVTQHLDNLDKQFRTMAQDFTFIRNLNKIKMGLFKMPGIFVRRTYGEPASERSEAMETGTFTLDVSGIANCYETAKGVGIHGRNADKSEKKKGIHWAVLVIVLPLLIIAAMHYGPKWIGSLFSRKITPAVAQASVGTQKSPRSENRELLRSNL